MKIVNITSETRAVWFTIFAVAGTFALTMGVRQTMGLFLSPLNLSTGLGLASISLAFAFGQIFWGVTQPIAGAYADRFGAGRVLLLGISLVALGTAITPMMTSTWGLILTIGVLAAGGAGIAGPAVLMSACMRFVPEDKQNMAVAIVNAGGSLGVFMMAPLTVALMVSFGWTNAMLALALMVLLALPSAWLFRGNSQHAKGKPVQRLGAGQAVGQALQNRSFLLLAFGFFISGFHVGFVATHLPGVVTTSGLPTQFGGWSLAMLGLFNIIGSVTMGWAVGRWRMKSLLSLVYVVRAVAIAAFLMVPQSGATVLIFASVMGLTFLSTVPPTAGLVTKLFGVGNMATLFGLVMLMHQMGGFVGTYLAGRVFEATGSFDLIWYMDAALAVFSALIHLPIREVQIGRGH